VGAIHPALFTAEALAAGKATGNFFQKLFFGDPQMDLRVGFL
jgi:hypothetical protein